MRTVRVQDYVFGGGFFGGDNQVPLRASGFAGDSGADALAAAIGLGTDIILLGRSTFEELERTWLPVQRSPDALVDLKRLAQLLTNTTKIVFSRTLKESEWEHTSLFDSDPVQVVSKLKRGNGGAILILGSESIVRQLASADLIDEYVLMQELWRPLLDARKRAEMIL